VASLAVSVYDYILMLPSEINFIWDWNSEWSSIKILFLVSRYSAFFDIPMTIYINLRSGTTPLCTNVIYIMSVTSTVIGLAVAEAILAIRTYALWRSSRRIFISLFGLLSMVCISWLILLATSAHTLESSEEQSNVVCYTSTRSTPYLFPVIAWSALTAFETVIVVLTLWIWFKDFGQPKSRLIITLYRDGILYFIYLFLISVANITVLLTFSKGSVANMLNTFQRAMHSILSCRIVLHIRETSLDPIAVSTIRLSNIAFEQSDRETGAACEPGES